MERRVKIAYLTVNDPDDQRSWSGIQYCIFRALQCYCGDVTALGPIKPLSVFPRKVLRKALRATTGRTYLYTHTASFARETARIAEKRLASGAFDLVFAPAGSGQVAYLNTSLPIVYLSDTTFSAVLEYYPAFSGLSQAAIREGNAIEQLAIDKASLVLYPSSWAAESARRDYHADPTKVHIVPLGANLDETPSAVRALNRTACGPCKLLFVGVDWARKGGDIALETLVELERLGIPSVLTIVGCVPPKQVGHKDLHVFHFLNKNDPSQRRQLERLYFQADLFLLPTRAECYGIALCEANAFGLPAITTDTGGVSEIIRTGENGILMPLSARGDQYARVVADLYADKDKLRRMQCRSRQEYEGRLNWDAWGKAVADLLAKYGRARQSPINETLSPS